MINEYVQKISGVFLRFSRHFRIFMFFFYEILLTGFMNLRDNFIIKICKRPGVRGTGFRLGPGLAVGQRNGELINGEQWRD